MIILGCFGGITIEGNTQYVDPTYASFTVTFELLHRSTQLHNLWVKSPAGRVEQLVEVE